MPAFPIAVRSVTGNDIEARRIAGEREARRRYSEIVARAPWLLDIPQLVKAITLQNCRARSKLLLFYKLADRISAAVTPSSACLAGCSFCCHIDVSCSQSEADLIGKAIGRPAHQLARRSPDELLALRDQFFRTPCSFLHDGKCSIYAHRPIACRVHFNITDTPQLCDPAIENYVPNVDLRTFWLALAALLFDDAQGDLREFF